MNGSGVNWLKLRGNVTRIFKALRVGVGFIAPCAIVLLLQAAVLPQQQSDGNSQQLGIPTASGSTSDLEVKIVPGKKFLVRQKGSLDWTPSSKLKEPMAVGFLDNGEKIYLPAKVIKPPKAKHSPDPQYPATEKGTEARVSLHFVVDRQGLVRFPTVDASPGLGFTKSAVEVVKKWTFKPAKLNGQPVAVLIAVSIHFSLYNPLLEVLSSL
jgi:TonB family protein